MKTGDFKFRINKFKSVTLNIYTEMSIFKLKILIKKTKKHFTKTGIFKFKIEIQKCDLKYLHENGYFQI